MKIKCKKIASFLLSAMLIFSTASVSFKSYAEKIEDVKISADYSYSEAENIAIANGFAPVLNNQNFTLYYKAETSEMAVYNRNNNEVLYSNPQDIPEDVTGLASHRLKSQLYVTYYVNNTQAKYFSSYYDCVNFNQNTAEIKDNTLVVEYVFGKESYSKEMLPIAIPKDKYEEKILPKLTDADKEILENAYKLTSIKSAKTDVARNKLIERYKNIEKTDLYVLDRYIPDYEVEAVYKSLFKYYTTEDFKEDNGAAGGTTEVANDSITFTLSLCYSLRENGLTVSLDCSQLTVSENADIDSVAILEFFGCGGKADSGYSVIPDGSGGVINFNTNKPWASEYSARIYGDDGAISYTNSVENKKSVQLPMYAIAKNESGIIAVASKGAGICSIISDIADDIIPYNKTAFCANVFSFDKMYVLNPEYGGGMSEVYVREAEPYSENIEINYFFLEKNKNTYANIAEYYRNMLIKNGTLSQKVNGETPFVFELVGAVDVNKHFLGIPYKGYEVLTSFEQAEEIIEAFSEQKISRMKVKLSGWFNGGLQQTDISKVNILSCLGGKRKLTKLMESKKADVFPQINVSTVSNKAFDGFSIKNEAARLTYNETALLYPISLSRGDFDYEEKYNYILSPAKYSAKVKSFNKKFNYKNIALSDLTTTLNSDFSADNYTSRIKAENITKDTLTKLKKGRSILASAPNEYAVEFVDVVTDMPLGTSGANIFDLEIPFVQMVFSGYKDMACEPINIYDNGADLLKLMAYGTLPNYTFMYAESSALKDTDYSNYYSLCFKDWQEEAMELYKDYCKDMQAVRGCSITGWEMITANVIKISYENGAVFVINQGDNIYEDGAVKVEGQSYSFYKGGLQ